MCTMLKLLLLINLKWTYLILPRNKTQKEGTKYLLETLHIVILFIPYLISMTSPDHLLRKYYVLYSSVANTG